MPYGVDQDSTATKAKQMPMIRKLWHGLKSLRRPGGASSWAFDERRELVRLRCHVEVSYTVGSKRYFGQIVDMSLGGMMLRCLQPPGIGTFTDVTYETPLEGATEKTVRCRVQWSKRRRRDHMHFAGLSYCSNEEVLRNSWVKVTLRHLGFRPERLFQKRKYVRVTCFIPVVVSNQAGERTDGSLYNLGAKGALLEAASSFEIGETVQLTIGPVEYLSAFQIQGRVVASNDINRLLFLGIEFEEHPKIDPNVKSYLRYLIDEGDL